MVLVSPLEPGVINSIFQFYLYNTSKTVFRFNRIHIIMRLPILSLWILSCLGSILVLAQDRDCGQGEWSNYAEVCFCNENFTGPKSVNNCFVLDRNKKITKLVTVDSCTFPCNWTIGSDIDPYNNFCVRPFAPVCG